MPVATTPNQITPMLLERSRSFALRMSFMLPDDTAVDLTGGTITLTMLQPVRKGTAVVLTKVATLVSPDIGYAVLDLQAADLDLEPGVYPYSITYLDADAYSATVVKGEAQIIANTDPLTANVYDANALDIELGFNNIVVTVNHLQAPTLQIGTVETVAYNNPAGAGIRGGYPHQLLDLKIPKGAPGGSQEAYDEAFGAAVAAANAHSDGNDALLQAALDSIEAMATATQAELDGYEASNDAALAAANAAIANAQAELDAYEASNDGVVASIISTMATDAELAAHAASTGTHGVGVIVGRDEAQTLKNKNLTDLSNSFPTWLVPVGTILEWPGFTAPFGFLMADGSAVSRATYGILWSVIARAFTGSITAGTTVINTADTTYARVGMAIDGPLLGAGRTITAINPGVSITFSGAAPGAVAAGSTFRLTPWGNGDGSTTFNLPSRLGRTAFGVDGSAEFARLAQVGGMKDHTHLGVDHLHGGVDHLHGIFLSSGYAGSGTRTASNASATQGADRSLTTGPADRNLTTSGANNGTTALNPYVAMNYVVRAA